MHVIIHSHYLIFTNIFSQIPCKLLSQPFTTTHWEIMARIRKYIVSSMYTHFSFIADEYSVTPSFMQKPNYSIDISPHPYLTDILHHQISNHGILTVI